MTREEAKQLLPVIQAWAEGKAIQYKVFDDPNSQWGDVTTRSPQIGGSLCEFRVKPQPKYRPFKNAEECWQEMQKHQPFGWLKVERGSHFNYCIIHSVDNAMNFKNRFDSHTFADGQPFGILEE